MWLMIRVQNHHIKYRMSLLLKSTLETIHNSLILKWLKKITKTQEAISKTYQIVVQCKVLGVRADTHMKILSNGTFSIVSKIMNHATMMQMSIDQTSIAMKMTMIKIRKKILIDNRGLQLRNLNLILKICDNSMVV